MSQSASHSSMLVCWRAFLLTSTILLTNSVVCLSLSTPSLLFDRFIPICPADGETVRNFDSSLGYEDNEGIWVAVYRSSNNKPSVFIRDEFLNAMRSATDAVNFLSQDSSLDFAFVNPGRNEDPSSSNAPVAVARLHQPEDASHVFLDSMRCVLKKEATDHTCDGSESGASEHTEALCVAIDALLEHYLQSNDRFEGKIRTKATLVSAPLLEARGFTPVSELCRDMATHVSSLDQCLSRYAERAVAASKSPAARQRAITIVSHLGRIDRTADLQEHSSREDKNDTGNGEDYDPWQSMRQYI